MKKIIAIISCIAILSSICVMSAFAYDRIDDIPYETIEISEREEIKEEAEIIRSSNNIETDKTYSYISTTNTFDNFTITNNDYSGSYVGQLRIGSTIIDNSFTFNSIEVTNNGNNIRLKNNDQECYIKDNSNIYNGKITFSSIGNNNSLNNYFKANITIYDPINDVYNNSDNFLLFTLNTLKTVINYCITNTVILIVISIVIISFAVGAMIRLKNKRF